jgi:8-oxo-dGTP diphosphatase
MLTVDAIVFSCKDKDRQIALIRRKNDPYAGCWGLPGGFVDMNETLDAAAARELQEETGLTHIALTQLYTFGDLGRDPRGRSISVAYYGLIPIPVPLLAADDASEAAWFPILGLPELAFDHDKIICCALKTLQG